MEVGGGVAMSSINYAAFYSSEMEKLQPANH